MGKKSVLPKKSAKTVSYNPFDDVLFWFQLVCTDFSFDLVEKNMNKEKTKDNKSIKKGKKL